MKIGVVLIPFILISYSVYAQEESFQDTTYVQTFTGDLDLTTRIYSSVKYSRLKIKDNELGLNLDYRTNVNYIIGFGVNYKQFALNIGLNFPFVNNDQDIRGETKYLDAQGHYYYEKSVVDLWLSRYKGYFLQNRYDVTDQSKIDSSYPLRPDMVNTNFGISAMHVFNAKKYSFRAAYAHDEWQKKSAGSLLLGSDVNVVLSKADSSHVPGNIVDTDFFDGYKLNRLVVLNLSVNGGYAHTFVIKKHLFVALSLVGSYGVRQVGLESEDPNQADRDSFKFNASVHAKAAIGYNSETFFIGFTGINSWIYNKTPVPGTRITQIPGNIRFHIVKRFKMNKPIYLPIVNKRPD